MFDAVQLPQRDQGSVCLLLAVSYRSGVGSVVEADGTLDLMITLAAPRVTRVEVDVLESTPDVGQATTVSVRLVLDVVVIGDRLGG